jgi:hypothetical protein
MKGRLDMKLRGAFIKMVALAVVVAMPLLGMSGIASAAKKGSPTWCAKHPAKAASVASCSSPSGSGTGSGAGADPPLITVQVDPTPAVETYQSDIFAIIQVETSASFAGDAVSISSSQLSASCAAVAFVNEPGVVSGSVILDDDGNATVWVEAVNCAPGSDVVEADLEAAPYYTALGTLVASPPVVTPPGVFGYPQTSGTVTTGEVETGDTTASGESDVYAVFYVETDPVYAEDFVALSSNELESRCGGGWFLGSFVQGIGATKGIVGPPALAALDDDGNAAFLFEGASCAAGTSDVVAEVLGGDHTTYTTTFTIDAPQPTI